MGKDTYFVLIVQFFGNFAVGNEKVVACHRIVLGYGLDGSLLAFG